MERTEQSLSNLKIALQCGGSDAFSGVSGNPLAAYVAKEVIRYGGCANLAETDELIGAERYVLQNVKDLETAQKFLDTIERFNERMARDLVRRRNGSVLLGSVPLLPLGRQSSVLRSSHDAVSRGRKCMVVCEKTPCMFCASASGLKR